MSDTIKNDKRPVLILGGTGYVGGRLLPLLLSRGIAMRAAVRNPEKLQCRSFSSSSNLEIVKCDVLDQNSLLKAALSRLTVLFSRSFFSSLNFFRVMVQWVYL
ncbi:MAG: NAD(P)H-binding protein [Desulfovibrionales bacterium]